VSYHLGANVGASPPGSPPPSPDRRRLLWTVAAGVLLVAGLATTAVASGLRDDEDETATTDSTGTTKAGDEATSTSIDTGDLGDVLGDLGTSGEAAEPLPGSDWSDEARSQFVTDCGANATLASAAGAAGMTPEDLCACTYDTIEESGTVTFEEFNEAYSAAEVDTSAPGTVAMQGAMFECAGLT
jgi:hypothetical protein